MADQSKNPKVIILNDSKTYSLGYFTFYATTPEPKYGREMDYIKNHDFIRAQTNYSGPVTPLINLFVQHTT